MVAIAYLGRIFLMVVVFDCCWKGQWEGGRTIGGALLQWFVQGSCFLCYQRAL